MKQLLLLLTFGIIFCSCTSNASESIVQPVLNEEFKPVEAKFFLVQVMNTTTGEVESIEDRERINPVPNDTLIIRDGDYLLSNGNLITSKTIYGYYIGHIPKNIVMDSVYVDYYKVVVLKNLIEQ